MELNETENKKDVENKNKLSGQLMCSILNLFISIYTNSLLPLYNNILLVHINFPIHIGLRSLIKNRLCFLLIYEKSIVGHVNNFVLLDFFIYFYNYLKFTDTKNNNNFNATTKKNMDPSKFTFKDLLKISANSKDLKIFDSNSKSIDIFFHFLNFNDECICIIDKEKGVISSTVKKRDIIYHILMNLKGKYYELSLSIDDFIKKKFITAYDDTPFIDVLMTMQTNKINFIPIVGRNDNRYIEYFSLCDLLALYCKSISEKWSINADKKIIYFLSILRNKDKEIKEKQNIIPRSYNELLKKNKLYTNETVNFSENSEIIIYNKNITVKDSLKKLFFSKINAVIVLNESKNVKGIITFRSLFNHLMHYKN